MPDETWWLEYGDLDDDQRAIVDLNADGSYLFLGPPGSGKTNLLLLRAAYLTRSQRPNVQILVFSRSLREFVARGVAHYQLDENQVLTIAKWGRDFLREYGFPTDDLPNNIMECRREIATRMKQAIDARPNLESSIECLFVDEIQDCLPEEISLFFRLGKDVCFAGDNRQRIYEIEDVVSGLKMRFGTENTKQLRFHYRNGVNICRAADVIGKTSGEQPIVETCNYIEAQNPSKVRFVHFDTYEDQMESLVAALESELKAYPSELLGVACPRRRDVDALRANLESSRIAENLLPPKSLEYGDNGCVYVTTLHDFKGLEFRTGHLVSMEQHHQLGAAQKRIAFTAMTRAKTLLTVYSVGSIPGYLKQAREVGISPSTLLDPTSLFPRKSSS